ncbi:UDP-N-acetyl glucosamine 2-epimerase [Candidatus Tenderia electrophaga]|jgi:UDP-N-acetylglucosamine 2-epimerase (non-hydrolysing)|uniref:UDP-N-acetyl glucosamine 2-epimerase n=1 Tax=Candidatus Tenderia electrophaga TaxID=1748243 RepID=A0A0S2TG55_9GAMM|nr:UDP-N-acetyl glucosamine 2-epimerase [Candidatus Tenderia electrophaga]
MAKIKIVCVVGARPNFMKIAPIMAQLNKPDSKFEPFLVHTGQHYDADMKHRFFDQLGIPEPDMDLGVGSGTHGEQTAEIMKRFEPVLEQQQPAAILVVGDVNSTIACALVAVKKNIKVIHVEAGLRSYDRAMPEEINRVLTDQISDLLFTTERQAHDNLQREGIAAERVHFVGNVMIDTLLGHVKRAVPLQQTLSGLAQSEQFFSDKGFALLTLHRPSNVDNRETLERLLSVVAEISEQLPVIFPVHPRTASRMAQFSLAALIDTPRICRLAPLGYLELLGAMSKAKLVLTDSGGIQEETTALGVPCITLRENTERPITVTQGTNVIVGTDADKIRRAVDDVLTSGGKAGRIPEYWDGKAAARIVAVLEERL